LNFTGVETMRGVLTTRADAMLRSFRDLGEPYGEVDALCVVVFANRFGDAREQLAALVRQGIALAEEIGYVLGQARLWYLLAVMCRQSGDGEAAARHAERSFEFAERSGSLHDQVLALWELAAAFPREAPEEKAIMMLLQRMIEVCRERGEQLLEAYLHIPLSALWLRCGVTDAGADLRRILNVFDLHSVSFGRAAGLRVLGEISLAYGDHVLALEHFHQALTICGQLRSSDEEALVLKNLGTAYREAGAIEEARSAWRNALRLFQRLGNTTAADQVTILLGPMPQPADGCAVGIGGGEGGRAGLPLSSWPDARPGGFPDGHR
jgi:tetratricopeptide (TPR) repeat protein